MLNDEIPQNEQSSDKLKNYMEVPEKILRLMALLIWIDIAVFMTANLFVADITMLLWAAIIYYVKSYLSARNKVAGEHGRPPSNIYIGEMKIGFFWGACLVLSFFILSSMLFYLSYFSFMDTDERYSGVYSFVFSPHIAVALAILTVGVALLCVAFLGGYKIFTGKYAK